jgi:site-specific DNA-methyltransferase (adenine-specific)
VHPDYINEEYGIRLYCGDCLAVLPTLDAGSVDAVVTDPPYGIGFKYDTHIDDSEEYKAIAHRVLESEALISNGYVAVYQSPLRIRQWQYDFPRPWEVIVLPKNFSQGGRCDIVPSTDFVLWWRVGERKGKPKEWQEVFARNWFLCDTSPAHRDKLSRGHPCPRPIDGCSYICRCFTRAGETILDPFMGSGTTGVSCVRTGRKFIGVEIDRGYFDIAVKRIEAAIAEKREQLIPA